MILIPYGLVFSVWAWQVMGCFSVKLLWKTSERPLFLWRVLQGVCVVPCTPALGASVVFVLMVIYSGSVCWAQARLFTGVFCAPGQVTVCT